MTRRLLPYRQRLRPRSAALAFLAIAVLLRCDRAGWIAAQEREGEKTAPHMALAQSSLPSRGAIPPAPQAEIDPARRVISQGQTAVFESKSRAASNNPIIAQEWAGPAGLKSTSSRFTIDTANLKPQTYPITLIVRDRLQRESEATAQLVVLPAKQQRGTSADPRRVFRSPVAQINPKTAQVTQGESVRLSSRSSRPDSGGPILRRTWRTQWGQTSSGDFLDIDTRALSAGNYWIMLEVADKTQARHTDRATIVVLPVFAATPSHPTYHQPAPASSNPGRNRCRARRAPSSFPGNVRYKQTRTQSSTARAQTIPTVEFAAGLGVSTVNPWPGANAQTSTRAAISRAPIACSWKSPTSRV